MGVSLPEKPTDAQWTDDQWKAIVAKNQDILVAAAAGSGKTAVLVERIIHRLLDEQEPINIDEILVATFTNAAAAEMKHRIGQALEKKYNEHPSAQLKKQVSLINRANISTLHSFCLEVIQKYYYLIDIDPVFRLADNAESLFLKDEVLETLLEEEYGESENESFFNVVDAFTNDRSDDALHSLILKLYDFSKSHPYPLEWLDQVVRLYEIQEDATIESLPFYEALKEDILLQLHAAKDYLEEAYHLALQPGGPAPRAENFMQDLQIVAFLEEQMNLSWKHMHDAMHSWSFSRAKACKGDEFNSDLVKRADKHRKKAKEILEKLRESLFSRQPESYINDMRLMKPIVLTLVELVKVFSSRLQQTKSEKGLLDFSDLEHFCLEILTADNEGELSDAAIYYQQKFKEVMVDEYQDTNLVQETILNCITNKETAIRFMVGDVKQSIYQFRLAEPKLFLDKYNQFSSDVSEPSLRIDLNKNFRSRKEVIHATNYLFKQLMGQSIGGIAYDEQAELKQGANYPEKLAYPVEWIAVNQLSVGQEDDITDEIDLEQSQLEARAIAKRIKSLIDDEAPVYDAKTGSMRPMQFKDIVILLRSMPWATTFIEECQQLGIPAYADISNGYFDATEVTIMLALLKMIDNPYQDIPVAAVLRSPIVGLDEETLANIRLASRQGYYYDALLQFVKETQASEVKEVIVDFLEKFDRWRSIARSDALSDLIWTLFRETYYYDYVGGLPGGKQRQANLRILYDRARQYEATAFRGLFRFLRFIERMQERGEDLGAAKALSEQEDVVRLMTIHASKGLEFPTVFVAGLGRQFNMTDIRQSTILDKEWGLASKYIDIKKRLTYPSLPLMAFKTKKKIDMIAEEMRVLYVALTRAKERLILTSTVKDFQKKWEAWTRMSRWDQWLLKDEWRGSANSYLDWIGPSLIRHRLINEEGTLEHAEMSNHESDWMLDKKEKQDLVEVEEAITEEEDWLQRVKKGSTVRIDEPALGAITEVLDWKYPYMEATAQRAKQSVSELKRINEQKDVFAADDYVQSIQKPIFKRPKFMSKVSLTPAEIGSAMHAMMQHISNDEMPTLASLEQLKQQMVKKELLSEEQAAAINLTRILTFYESNLGSRMIQAKDVLKEVPFSYSLSDRDGIVKGEKVLVQGIIDCLFEDEQGIVLLDYKTDNITEKFNGDWETAAPILKKRYSVQMELYKEAVESIWKKPITHQYLYFFDGGHILKI